MTTFFFGVLVGMGLAGILVWVVSEITIIRYMGRK